MKRILLSMLLGCLPLVPLQAEQIQVAGFGAAEAGVANQIGIEGVSTAQVGQEITLRLTGTPPIDLSKPLVGQLEWLTGASRMYCYLASPGCSLASLDVRGELVFGATGATIQPLLRVTGSVRGEHRILVDWNHGQDQLIEHRLVVGGEAPTPNPTPDPQPNPNPNPNPTPDKLSEMWIIVVEESNSSEKGGRTNLQALVLLNPTVRGWMETNGHHFRLVDNDLKASDLQGWIAETVKGGHDLPYLFAVGEDSTVIFEGALPQTPDALLELCQKYGREK